MNTRIILFAGLLTLATGAQAATLCQQKEQAISRELDIARQHNNAHQVAGLSRALSETQANCNDDALKRSHQQKIQRLKQKVTERKQELAEEQNRGSDAKRIAKRQKKLAEAERKLHEQQNAPY